MYYVGKCLPNIAIFSIVYSSLYPDRCDLLICLDALMKPYLESKDKMIAHIQKIGSDFLLLDQLNRSGKEPPTYTHDEIAERWIKQTNMSEQGVKHLIERGVCQSKSDPNRFYFSRDIRLKVMEYGPTSIPESAQYKVNSVFLIFN